MLLPGFNAVSPQDAEKEQLPADTDPRLSDETLDVVELVEKGLRSRRLVPLLLQTLNHRALA